MNENYWKRLDQSLNWIRNFGVPLNGGESAYYASPISIPQNTASIFSTNPVSQFPKIELDNEKVVENLQQYRRYNINTQPQKLEFQKAKNMREAVAYARKLGIKNFDMDGDLGLANWVNEGLTEIYNKYNGKAPMPSNVIKDGGEEMVGDAYYSCSRDTLAIAPDNKKRILSRLLDNIDSPWESSKRPLVRWYRGVLQNDFSQISYIDPKFQKQVAKHITQFQNFSGRMDVSEVKQLYHEINALLETKNMPDTNPLKLISNIYNNPKYKKAIKGFEFKSLAQISKLNRNAQKQEFYNIINKLKKKGINAYVEPQKFEENNSFHVIFHEYGHFRHFNTTSFTALKQRTNEFVSNVKKQKTAGQVSSYAKSEPMEFVAEVYAGLLNGVKYSPEVMALYKTYNGPPLPQ